MSDEMREKPKLRRRWMHSLGNRSAGSLVYRDAAGMLRGSNSGRWVERRLDPSAPDDQLLDRC